SGPARFDVFGRHGDPPAPLSSVGHRAADFALGSLSPRKCRCATKLGVAANYSPQPETLLPPAGCSRIAAPAPPVCGRRPPPELDTTEAALLWSGFLPQIAST